MKKTIICCITLLFLLGAFGLCMTAAAQTAPVIIASGYCGGEGDGTNLTWKYDSSGTLTITGTGAMADFTPYYTADTEPPPWKSRPVKKRYSGGRRNGHRKLCVLFLELNGKRYASGGVDAHRGAGVSKMRFSYGRNDPVRCNEH